MTVEITRPGKNSLTLDTPVMPASGIFGFGDVYRDLVNIEKLGALVTNPITYQPWTPATGTRVVPLDAGVLMHTGLPNPGLTKVLNRYRGLWTLLPIPVIVHIVATTIDHVERCAEQLENETGVAAIELGLNDDITWREAERVVTAMVEHTEKPVLVRLPLQDAYEIAGAVADSGAGALVIAAPPRGTARDPLSGRLIGGRVYGPLVRPMVLRVVGQLVNRIEAPIIGAGGIHSAQDARDYLEAGAVAVQIDSVTWIDPKMIEIIGRDLGGMTVTREFGALGDEWYPGMSDTTREDKRRKNIDDTSEEN